MLSRSLLRRTALILLGALLFAQGALAMASCDWPARSAARAIAEQAEAPCHQSEAETRNPNLCLAHCQDGLQSLDKASFTVHAMPAAPVLSLALPQIGLESAQAVPLSFQISPPGTPPPGFFQVMRQ